MKYEQALLAFAAPRLPEVVAALTVLAVAARRWRDDRAAAGLLAAAGGALALHVAAETPLFRESHPVLGALSEPLWKRAFGGWVVGDFRAGWSAYWLVAALPAVAAWCGFAAVFLRTDPAAGPSAGPPAVS